MFRGSGQQLRNAALVTAAETTKKMGKRGWEYRKKGKEKK
jgi:hypothetical protein